MSTLFKLANPKCMLVPVVLMLSLLAAPAWSQDASKQALDRAQMMLKKMNSEKQALQQNLAALQQQFDDSQAELELVKQESAREQKKLRATLSEWKGSHARVKGSLQDTRSELQLAKLNVKNLSANLNRQTANFNLCFENNNKLFDINKELLSHYTDKSAWDAVVESEPFLQLKQVEVENLVQDYRYQLEDLNLSMMHHQIHPVSHQVIKGVSDEQ